MAADIYRVRVTIGGAIPAPALLTTYWAPNSDTAQQCADEAVARVRAFLNSWAPRGASGATVAFDLNVQGLDSATGQLQSVVVAAAPSAVTPAQTGDQNPGLIQGLFQFNTGAFVNGRALKGRLFMPATMEFDNGTVGQPNSTHITAMNTAIGLLGTTVSRPNPAQVIWHRPVGGSGGSFATVQSRAFSTSWAVLKSRRS